jgi:hypothetical protein
MVKRKNMQPIEWHLECARNHGANLDRSFYELLRKQEAYYHSKFELEAYRRRISEAQAKGKTELEVK